LARAQYKRNALDVGCELWLLGWKEKKEKKEKKKCGLVLIPRFCVQTFYT
jgi:hypothetical protein